MAYDSTGDDSYAERALQLMARAAIAHDDYILHFLKGSSPFMTVQDCEEGRWPSNLQGLPAGST
eukprot:SAG31_NODE_11069_length_1069_cov_1.613402_2_plen_64_part_00